ncbi:hypothetical protein [Bacillus thuringiensis]|nr:hypothetical protein [Bacillus thuringiensis]
MDIIEQEFIYRGNDSTYLGLFVITFVILVFAYAFRKGVYKDEETD